MCAALEYIRSKGTGSFTAVRNTHRERAKTIIIAINTVAKDLHISLHFFVEKYAKVRESESERAKKLAHVP